MSTASWLIIWLINAKQWPISNFWSRLNGTKRPLELNILATQSAVDFVDDAVQLHQRREPKGSPRCKVASPACQGNSCRSRNVYVRCVSQGFWQERRACTTHAEIRFCRKFANPASANFLFAVTTSSKVILFGSSCGWVEGISVSVDTGVWIAMSLSFNGSSEWKFGVKHSTVVVNPCSLGV